MSNRRTEEMVADRILELLDRGELPPWEQPYQMSAPMNAISRKPYRGINHWLIRVTHLEKGYEDPRWLTLKQANQLGGSIRQGEHSSAIVFWKHVEKDSEEKGRDPDSRAGNPHDADEKKRPDSYWLTRTYRVFNVEQTRNCQLEPLAIAIYEHDPLEAAEELTERITAGMTIITRQQMTEPPHYNIRKNTITVPTKETYKSLPQWYNTVFHEVVHATGHPSRLGRFTTECTDEQMHSYGLEELIAGMGSAMLCQEAGLERETLEQNAAYIKNWRDAILADKSMVLRAAGKAQKAVDYVMQQREELQIAA